MGNITEINSQYVRRKIRRFFCGIQKPKISIKTQEIHKLLFRFFPIQAVRNRTYIITIVVLLKYREWNKNNKSHVFGVRNNYHLWTFLSHAISMDVANEKWLKVYIIPFISCTFSWTTHLDYRFVKKALIVNIFSCGGQK